MSDTVEIGQVVTLQSGGPSMTVQNVEGSIAKCVWFEGALLKTEQFDSVLLCPPRRSQSAEDIDIDVDNFG